MGTVNTTERLTQLRQLMKEHQVDLYSRCPAGQPTWNP